MSTLHLNLKKKWFGMIQAGTKLEEYREITPHFISLLFDWKGAWQGTLSRKDFVDSFLRVPDNSPFWVFLKDLETITFSNGYAKDRPQIIIEIDGIDIGKGLENWGAEPGKKYFIFQLGTLVPASEC